MTSTMHTGYDNEEIGLVKEEKMKGLAEFSFTNKDLPSLEVDFGAIKKKEKVKIITRDANRRNCRGLSHSHG